MNKNISPTLKVIVLAFVLSLGISYVAAWTAPTSQPPAGNTSAPINVSSNPQTKAGNLTVSNDLIAPVFKDQNDTSYFLNPNGDSVLANIYAGKICFGADCKTAWPTGAVTSVNAGSGISVSPTTGAVTVANTGVTSVNGQTGAVAVSTSVPSGTLCGADSYHTGDSGGGQPGPGSVYYACQGAPRGTCPAGYTYIMTSFSTYDATTYFYSCAKN